METKLESWWNQFLKHNPYLVLVVATIMFAIFFVNDSYIMQNKLPQAKDETLLVIAYLSAGSVIGLVVNALLSLTNAGKVVDPTFTRTDLFSWEKVRPIQKQAFASGALAAIATGLFLWGSLEYDPAIVATLSAGSILFVALMENMISKKKLGYLIGPAIFASVGAGLFGLARFTEDTKLAGSVLVMILLLFFIRNIISAGDDIFGMVGSRKSDGTTFSFYRFFWLSVTGVTATFIYCAATGNLGNLMNIYSNMFPEVLPWILLTMVLVFLSNGWRNTLKKHKYATNVTMVFALSSIFAFIITEAINNLWPGTFGEVPDGDASFVLRLAGCIIIILSIAASEYLKPKQEIALAEA